eukprot:COSAG01_NODE_27801_length_676_cov_1.951473_1_plen_107_part_10
MSNALYMTNYDATYSKLHKIGYNGYPTQSAPMYIFGGTIGTTGNAYKQDGIIMPRPNADSRPGTRPSSGDHQQTRVVSTIFIIRALCDTLVLGCHRAPQQKSGLILA